VNQSLSQSDIERICHPFFDEIKQNHFQVRLTTGGSLCIIISRNAGGDKPIMGVYWSGEEWMPVKWDNEGRYISKEHPRKLDIDVSQEQQETA
jgi:hypothetical protein